MNDHELAGELQKVFGAVDNTTILLKVVEGKLAAENVHEIRNQMQRMVGEMTAAAEAERITILGAYREMDGEAFQAWLQERCGITERTEFKPLSQALNDVDVAQGRKDGDDAAGE